MADTKRILKTVDGKPKDDKALAAEVKSLTDDGYAVHSDTAKAVLLVKSDDATAPPPKEDAPKRSKK
jgi:hypothetical protein